jgi:hypothetical protein
MTRDPQTGVLLNIPADEGMWHINNDVLYRYIGTMHHK